jgi:hypothetical protein
LEIRGNILGRRQGETWRKVLSGKKFSVKGTVAPDQIGLKVVWLDRPHHCQADLISCDGTFTVSNVTGFEKRYRRIGTRGSKESMP